MSFSGNVKEELTKKLPSARHCQMAELAGIFHFCGQLGITSDGFVTVGFASEKESIVRKGFTLLKKTYNIETELPKDDQKLKDFLGKIGNPDTSVSPMVVKNTCCQRAFLRGAFLASGSISDPSKAYHIEYICPNKEMAEQLKAIINEFGIYARITSRRKCFIVYLKEGEAIVDLLNVLEAPLALMEMENTRIYKEVNNSVNRLVNCEMSNIRKTVGASARQIEDIRYIREHMGIEKLPDSLKDMAMIRLEYPEAPLQELGEYLDPPVGKSGVNHRLRRLGEIAEKLREERGEAQHP